MTLEIGSIASNDIGSPLGGAGFDLGSDPATLIARNSTRFGLDVPSLAADLSNVPAAQRAGVLDSLSGTLTSVQHGQLAGALGWNDAGSSADHSQTSAATTRNQAPHNPDPKQGTFVINNQGMVTSPDVKIERRPLLERGPMPTVHGIIVHQTDSHTAASSLESYKTHPVGAHFLIDKDGTVYQTASVHERLSHVGKLRARCVAEDSCAPKEASLINKMGPTERHLHEKVKAVPDRYPDNTDSIGIELVGKAVQVPGHKEPVYEAVTPQQNAALSRLINNLTHTLNIDRQEIFPHPTVSQKMPSEASTARW